MSDPTDLDRPLVLDPTQLNRIEATHRGFLFQHLYVVRTLLLSAGSDVATIVVEGDEDVEILRPDCRAYIQVKVRAETLGWSDIKGALDRFAQYRALHVSGNRAGQAVFVIASSAPPNPSLLERMKAMNWPKDVRIDWPNAKMPEDTVMLLPKANLLDAFTECRELTATLPFAMLSPETLVWKLAGLVTLAAAGGEPRTGHRFEAKELTDLFEQLVVQMQDFPSPPPVYRLQSNEPALLDNASIRLIAGYSGAGKTSWVAQASMYVSGRAAYFDVRDVIGATLAGSLARELAARLHGAKGGRLGQILMPGAAGLEILQALSRGFAETNERLTIVLDNVHLPPAEDINAVVRAAPAFRFVLLGQPSGLSAVK